MPRQKSQRPKVFAAGKREKLWKCQYREYFLDAAGKEQFHHRSESWSQDTHTKRQAQAACDKLMAELQAGPPKADGGMTLADFWRTIYLPIRSRRWNGSTLVTAPNIWKNHIEPKLGAIPLKDITKATIEIRLGEMADAGLGHSMIESVRVRLKSIFEESLDNGYLEKNPCRKVEVPKCKPAKESRSLTEAEVCALFEGSSWEDYLMWRVLILTGPRCGELIALTRDDITPDGLKIDETILYGRRKLPKREKIRMAALPDSLREELTVWLSGHNNHVIFPCPTTDKAYRSTSAEELRKFVNRGRALGIRDLTPRMCRTTFGTLFQGDDADRSSIMGHTSTAFTMERYRRPILERRQKSVEELDRLLKVVRIDKKRQA